MEFTIQTTRQKKRIIFVLLGIFFGPLGIHNLYIGWINRGLFQAFISCLLAFTFIIPLIMWMWGIYEVLTVRDDYNGLPLK
jgi:TM2 domain-containing membrane protein YozV